MKCRHCKDNLTWDPDAKDYRDENGSLVCWTASLSDKGVDHEINEVELAKEIIKSYELAE